MKESTDMHEFCEGDVKFWTEQGTSIHIKAIAAFGDPVELSREEAREFAFALLEAAKKLDS